jgi:type I restriction enzyme S subunit
MVPFIKVSDMARPENARFVLGSANWITEDQVANLKWKPFSPGTIVFAKIGEALKANRFRILVRPTLIDNNMMGAVPRVDRVNPTFLFFLLRTKRLYEYAAGSALPYLRSSDLGRLRVVVPSLSGQSCIAEVLSAIDDKIDSNRGIVSLLEEAITISFRARFVDFVSVEKFAEHELGRIPLGWQFGSLVNIARFVNGKALTKYANGKGRPILRIKELNSGIGDATPHTDVDVPHDYCAHADDILFAWSGSLAAYRWSGPESVINQHIFKVIPNGWPAWFVYGWLQEHIAGFQAIARDKATTMGHIQRHHLTEAVVPLPVAEVLAGAEEVLGSLYQQRAMLAKESVTLVALRDALLPKLISGELRVPDTTDPEEVIGPAAEALVEARA